MASDNESDFYGDDVLVDDLEMKVEDLDLYDWWTSYNTIKTPLKLQSRQLVHSDVTHFHNPYAGCEHAWQLSESVDYFLDRLPPATTTDKSGLRPWIFICNPYIARKSKSGAQNQHVKGCEDEGPEEEGSDLPRFCEGGVQRLHLVTAFHYKVNHAAMTPTIRSREKNKASTDASNDIMNLAHGLHVRAGKWMLFCTVHTVNDIWSVVAKATVSNELGIAAKVATRSELDPRIERLICVYTADFQDRDDVERVALKLKQLGLVSSRGKPLYYKPDAYTYLGIGSGNAWGIRASIYNTRDIFEKNF